MSHFNKIVIQEVDKAIAFFSDNATLFSGKKILVTGATGFLGSQIILFFSRLSNQLNLNISLNALVRSKEKAEKIFRGLQVNIYDSSTALSAISIDVIFHCASMTTSQLFIDKPVETIHTSVFLTNEMLVLARKCGAKLVYLSSMEVFGRVENDNLLTEQDYGYIDILTPRSSYPESKRLCECLCAAFSKEYNVNVSIARLCQTFGPGISYDDSRIMAEFCRCVIEERSIILKTDGSSVRNCCASIDAITALATLACFGKTGEAYNIANPDLCMSIRETAEFICNNYPNVDMKFEIDKNAPYPPSTKIQLDTTKIQALGWKARVDLKNMFDTTILAMKSTV